MSLYEDEPMESGKDGNSSKSNWSDSLKMLQGSVHAKKFHQQQMKKDSNKGFIPPVADLRRKRAPPLPRYPNGEITFNSITGKMEVRDSTYQPVDLSGPPASVTALIQNITSNMSVFGYNDEYDPMRPNDYSKLKEQRKRETEKQRTQEEEPRGLYDDFDTNDDDYSSLDKESSDRSTVKKGNVFAPPPSLIEEDRRASTTNTNETVAKDEFSLNSSSVSAEYQGDIEMENVQSNPGFSSTKGALAVAKMMAKMGYREGQGLGKSQQGMSSALVVEKTSKRGGKILHEKDLTTKDTLLLPPPPPLPPPTTMLNQSSAMKGDSGVDIACELKHATKVVLLKNMVGPGEVDELLDGETKEECQKYGEVEKCLIFEIPGAAEEEAVRIFVEFKRVESAIKAVVDMNGRYFAGRVVRAKFYDFEKFRQFDLADDS